MLYFPHFGTVYLSFSRFLHLLHIFHSITHRTQPSDASFFRNIIWLQFLFPLQVSFHFTSTFLIIFQVRDNNSHENYGSSFRFLFLILLLHLIRPKVQLFLRSQFFLFRFFYIIYYPDSSTLRPSSRRWPRRSKSAAPPSFLWPKMKATPTVHSNVNNKSFYWL